MQGHSKNENSHHYQGSIEAKRMDCSLSKFPKRCLSFYKVLKKDKSFMWNKGCEKAIT